MRCVMRIRGTSAVGSSAPDLTHLMRPTACWLRGTLQNTPANLEALIQNPQEAKPASLMPDQDLSAQQLKDVLTTHMETLL